MGRDVTGMMVKYGELSESSPAVWRNSSAFRRVADFFFEKPTVEAMENPWLDGS